MSEVECGAKPSPKVLLAETDALYNDLIHAALRRLDLDVVRLEGHQHIVATAAEAGATLVVIGPSYDVTDLKSAIPRLLVGGTRTLVLADGATDLAAAGLLLVGASGYLLMRDTSAEEFETAVRRIMSGASALHPDIVHAILQDWRQARDHQPVVAAEAESSRIQLTSREMEVLRGLRDGLTTRLLASRLGVAEKTVESHKSRLFTKLGVRAQAHAVKVGSDLGLL